MGRFLLRRFYLPVFICLFLSLPTAPTAPTNCPLSCLMVASFSFRLITALKRSLQKRRNDPLILCPLTATTVLSGQSEGREGKQNEGEEKRVTRMASQHEAERRCEQD